MNYLIILFEVIGFSKALSSCREEVEFMRKLVKVNKEDLKLLREMGVVNVDHLWFNRGSGLFASNSHRKEWSDQKVYRLMRKTTHVRVAIIIRDSIRGCSGKEVNKRGLIPSCFYIDSTDNGSLFCKTETGT